jgi:lysophospholipase L1-like esterase
MTRSHAFRPSVLTLEDRSLPTSSIYSIPALNQLQDKFVAQAEKANNPVVFFGDSITFNWGATFNTTAPGYSLFQKDFAPLGAANFGIPGDGTADLVQRIWGGDFAGKPKVAVVMIGINDLILGETPLQTAEGIVADVGTIEQASPKTTILLLGLLPTTNPILNPEVQEVNSMISGLANLPGVVYENPGALLLGSANAARPALLIDQIHPNSTGYLPIANAIDGTVVGLLEQADLESGQPIPFSTPPGGRTTPIIVPTPPVLTSASASDEVVIYIPTATTADASTGLIPSTTTANPRNFATELIDASTG